MIGHLTRGSHGRLEIFEHDFSPAFVYIFLSFSNVKEGTKRTGVESSK